MKKISFKTRGESGQLTTVPVIIPPEIQSLELLKVKDEHLLKEIRLMVTRHSTAWSEKLGTITHIVLRIELITNARPVQQMLYRQGPQCRKVQEEEVERILVSVVIQPSKSEWASPVIMVPKPDESLRFCVDHLRLNELRDKDYYPILRMDECVESLGEAIIIITSDANNGFRKVPLAEAGNWIVD